MPPLPHLEEPAPRDAVGQLPGDGASAEEDLPVAISPSSSGSRPEIAFRVVVFPAPFDPSSATMAPSGTERESPFRTWTVWW